MSDLIPHKCSKAGCQNPTTKRYCAECNTQTKDPWYTSKEWRAIRAAHLRRQPDCQCSDPSCDHAPGFCLRSQHRQVDHRIPIAQGGDRRASSNLQTLCRTCHSRKTYRENAGLPTMHSDSKLSSYIEQSLAKEEAPKAPPYQALRGLEA